MEKGALNLSVAREDPIDQRRIAGRGQVLVHLRLDRLARILICVLRCYKTRYRYALGPASERACMVGQRMQPFGGRVCEGRRTVVAAGLGRITAHLSLWVGRKHQARAMDRPFCPFTLHFSDNIAS